MIIFLCALCLLSVSLIRTMFHRLCVHLCPWILLVLHHGVMNDSTIDSYFYVVHDVFTKIAMTMAPMTTFIERKINQLKTKQKPKRKEHLWQWTRRPSIRHRLLNMSVIACAAVAKPSAAVALFDTDSQVVGIDNRSSACMSNVSEDFVPGTLKPVTKVRVKTYQGYKDATNMQIGTLVYRFCDDDGVPHTFKVPNSFFDPDGQRLLSPQHWAKHQKDPIRIGTGNWTGPNEMVLYWKGRKHKRTIPLSNGSSNVGDLHLAPGHLNHKRFCESQRVDPETLPADFAFTADPTIIPPDEDEASAVELARDSRNFSDEWETERDNESPRVFNLSGPSTQQAIKEAPDVVVDEEDQMETKDPPVAELLRWHQRFGHLSFTKLQWMARKGIIPKRLAKCQTPFCSACAYAKATKRPWRSRTSQHEQRNVPITKPGQVVSVDQLMSPAPGLIAQMSGFAKTRQ